ncbi:TRAP transporter small permease [Desulfovibrio sp. OttesenSCG-928-I05]|nr:TRAP transporter small permease [Desulfovibrio sp. OttesenSCG-928-I05]
MGKVLQSLGALNDLVARLGAIAVVAIMVVAVFMRYIVGAPLQWVEELLIAIFIWLIMLGAVSSMRVRGHVSIDAVTNLLPLSVQRRIAVFVDIVSIFSLVTLGWLGLELSLNAGGKITSILQIPYKYIDLAVPVGCFWMAMYVCFHLVADMRGEGFTVKDGEEKA